MSSGFNVLAAGLNKAKFCMQITSDKQIYNYMYNTSIQIHKGHSMEVCSVSYAFLKLFQTDQFSQVLVLAIASHKGHIQYNFHKLYNS